VLNLLAMNAQRTSKSTRGRDPRAEPDSAGSGPRRRSSQPETRRASGAAALPPLDSQPAARASDPELEQRLFMIVTAVAEEEGLTYPPEWAAVVDAAKRRGFVHEKGLHLYLASGGRQWLASRASPSGGRAWEMTKISLHHRLLLKALARETGVNMQTAIGDVISAVYENRDALTRVARRVGAEHPWEAIGVLVREGKKA